MKSVPSPARLGFQLGEQEQAVAVEGQAPSQLPPGPLPANQGLIAAGLAQQLHLLAGGPAVLLGRGSALCPSKLETIWTEGGSPVFTVPWTSSTCWGRLQGPALSRMGGAEQEIGGPRGISLLM